MRIIKCVVQNYTPSEDILELLEDFRLMLNECIRIGIRDNLTSMKSLSTKAYHILAHYDVASCYRLTAISKAAGLLRSYRKFLRKNQSAKVPYVKKLSLTDCYGFRIQENRLRLTMRAREHAYVDLNPHTLAAISGNNIRSVTLTTRNLSLAYSKEANAIEIGGLMGIDSNLDNLTIASSEGAVQTFDLSNVTQIKEAYRTAKSHFKRNDARIGRSVFAKYGTLQRDRVGWILNNVSASVVKQAKEGRFGIVMEDIKGIRKLYRRGNGQSGHYRARLNSWSFHELQRQIEYKARWDGIPVIYVAAWGTSTKCSMCGTKTFPNEDRTLHCPKCKTTIDRDVNAARNILAKGAVRFAADGFAGEAVKGNETTTPILRVDANQLTSEASA